MKKATRFVGLDVHADTIAVAVAENGRDGEVRSLGIVPNRPEAIRKLVHRLGGTKGVKACYEAGPTGYALYWQLQKLGIETEVIAPTLVPVKAGERVKTDRRDAAKLARCYRAGELTPVWVPDPAHEALRDLVRAREAAKKDQLRARHRLSKFLLRNGRRAPSEVTTWGTEHMVWVRAQKFEQPAHEATMVDYLAEVDHSAARITRLEEAIDVAARSAPPILREVIAGLQAMRGLSKIVSTTCRGDRQLLSLRASKPTDGVQRRDTERILEREEPIPGSDHEDGQFPREACAVRGGLELSPSSKQQQRAREAPARTT